MFDNRSLGYIVAVLLLSLINVNAKASEYENAVKHGKVNTKIMGCPASGFWDPRNGGECWSCPTGTQRTLSPVHSDKACVAKASKQFAAAKQLANHMTLCPKGSFLDPRNGGECWSCPAGTNRTAYGVNSSKACSKRIAKKKKVAEYSHKRTTIASSCGKGKFANVGSRSCYTCPSGYKHNPTKPVESNGVCYKPAYTKHYSAELKRELSGLKCDNGFYDPIDRGSCWTCPSGYNRSVSSVKSDNACVKKIPAKYKAANFHSNKRPAVSSVTDGLKSAGCANFGGAAFFDLVDGGTCWSCPKSNPIRTLYPVDSNKACATKTCGKENARPCYITERFPSCNKGLVEDPIKNKCVRPKNLACTAMVNTIAAINKAVKKANATGEQLQNEAIERIPGAKGLMIFLENQNAQVAKQVGKVTNQLNFQRVDEEFKKLVAKHAETVSGMARAAKIAQNSQRALEEIFTDANLICNGNTEQIDKRLAALGIVDAAKPQQKQPVFKINMGSLLGIKDAHAAAATNKMTFDFNVSVPYKGADWGLGLQYATDFNGNRGVYFMHSVSKSFGGKDDLNFVPLGSAGFAVGWSYSGGHNPCVTDWYSWGVPITIFGPLGIGINCSGFGGMALSLSGDLQAVNFLSPANVRANGIKMPRKVSISKPERGKKGVAYEGAISIWESDPKDAPGIY